MVARRSASRTMSWSSFLESVSSPRAGYVYDALADPKYIETGVMDIIMAS